MATEISAIVGSGNQPWRKEFHGERHNGALAVNVVNWEDNIPVHTIRTAGFHIGGVTAEALPSGQAALPGRRVIAIYNTDATSNPVYIGPSGVTAANGYPIAAGTEKAFAIAANLLLYAITAASGTSVNLRTIEIA
jgi:hypothetical protein